jgi:hypothetical protein
MVVSVIGQWVDDLRWQVLRGSNWFLQEGDLVRVHSTLVATVATVDSSWFEVLHRASIERVIKVPGWQASRWIFGSHVQFVFVLVMLLNFIKLRGLTME